MDIETKKHDAVIGMAQEIINQFNLTSRNIKIIVAKMCLMGKIDNKEPYWYLLGETDVVPFFSTTYDMLCRINKIILKNVLENYRIDFGYSTVNCTNDSKFKLYLRIRRK